MHRKLLNGLEFQHTPHFGSLYTRCMPPNQGLLETDPRGTGSAEGRQNAIRKLYKWGGGNFYLFFLNGYPVQLYHVESDANFTKNRSMPQLVILVRFAVVIVGSRAPDKGGVFGLLMLWPDTRASGGRNRPHAFEMRKQK